MLHRRDFCFCKKGGLKVGKTKRGKGTKIMAIADSHGLPVSVGIESASPHEINFIDDSFENRFTKKKPELLIGDAAYDSDPEDERVRKKHGTLLVAPHKKNRKRQQTQDGRTLRRYKKRWRVERLFAWIQCGFRRTVTRWEYHAENYLGMVQLACIIILLRHL